MGLSVKRAWPTRLLPFLCARTCQRTFSLWQADKLPSLSRRTWGLPLGRFLPSAIAARLSPIHKAACVPKHHHAPASIFFSTHLRLV